MGTEKPRAKSLENFAFLERAERKKNTENSSSHFNYSFAYAEIDFLSIAVKYLCFERKDSAGALDSVARERDGKLSCGFPAWKAFSELSELEFSEM